MQFHSKTAKWTAAALAAALVIASTAPVKADVNCQPITASSFNIAAVSCTQIWAQLQASGQFPDAFAGNGKLVPGLCYAATGPAAAQIGNTPVTITATASAWTTDFTPTLFGGSDNLGTVITQLTISGLYGTSSANLYTRDTIDLSQIAKGTASEEDVIVGGDSYLVQSSGTYRVASVPQNQNATLVALNGLNGIVCTH